ncbi:hypothetical protein HPB51_023923 [Rhipicephalus microplus]|uniref:Uncharacterized protein n=1 Tax=Rhipicephalus microplus TaxID=6941 RepID=A0A9J6DD88_RHIMP|nr:hypothetical protein HPB51_023923 [Rhipicephalus microplus]
MIMVNFRDQRKIQFGPPFVAPSRLTPRLEDLLTELQRHRVQRRPHGLSLHCYAGKIILSANPVRTRHIRAHSVEQNYALALRRDAMRPQVLPGATLEFQARHLAYAPEGERSEKHEHNGTCTFRGDPYAWNKFVEKAAVECYMYTNGLREEYQKK